MARGSIPDSRVCDTKPTKGSVTATTFKAPIPAPVIPPILEKEACANSHTTVVPKPVREVPEPLDVCTSETIPVGIIDQIEDPLTVFLELHKNCLISSPTEFVKWLKYADVNDLNDLAEALEDTDFVEDEMQPKGLKSFKRLPLLKAALAHGSTSMPTPHAKRKMKAPARLATNHVTAPEIPRELEYLISHELMVDDPVLAQDGYTYERKAIENWFAQFPEGASVCSPMTQKPLAHTILTPNHAVRTMARDFLEAQSHDRVGTKQLRVDA
eukprot:scaffold96_cov172-Amphora_coffeaeformis.AAC.6